jgi:hypothetical protein
MIQSVHVISVLTCDVLLACRWNFIAICCVDREFKINSITAVVPSWQERLIPMTDCLCFPFLPISVFPMFVGHAIQLTV